MSIYKRRHELVERAKKLAGKPGMDDCLDESVHDVKSQEASEINNKGVEEQAEFLIDAFGMDEFEKLLKEMDPDG